MKHIVTMECNKEDVETAKKLAEEKMKAGDFVGAHKLITKAQRLFPDLENIPQMIAICDVHSSANKKISGLDNWYGILQVQPLLADADTIKKQYRKLALLLHPDKNKFPGAEAAFKLVGEANRWLSDQIKRSQYDTRYRSHSMLASRNLNTNLGRRFAAGNNAAENLMFWTCCKHCGHRYKYLREYMLTVMQCSTCLKPYLACKIEGDGVPPSSSTAGKKEFQGQGMYNTSGQNASTGAEPGSSAAEMDKNGTVRGKLKKKNQETQKKGASDRKPKKDEDCTEIDTEPRAKPQNVETGTSSFAEIPKADVLKPQAGVKAPDTSAAKSIPDLSAPYKYQAAKKRRKAVEESSKSFGVDGSDVAGTKTDTNEYNKRKSSRKKPQISCAETGGDGDFISPPNKKTKSSEFESDSNTKQTAEDKKSPELANSGVSSASHAYKGKTKKYVNSGNEDIMSAKSKESEGCGDNVEDVASSRKIDKVDNGCKASENPNRLDIPDPQLNVFEVERKTENFAVNQVWSITDPRDGMPRKYARVKKVLNAEFKVRITYLEPVQDVNDESIPFACGKFKNGKTNDVEDRSMFSSQVFHLSWYKNVFIHPRKGEIWAIFRDWKEEWNASLKNHILPYNYDFVEIVSDFHGVNGLGVAYLGKLEGSVPLFHRKAKDGILQIQFRPQEMLRFSHKVPAVKMIGEENECIPADSYELDPAALPKNIFQVDAVDMDMDSEILKGKADCLYPEAPKVVAKAKLPETAPSPRKRQKSDADNDGYSNLGEVKGGTSKSHEFSSCQVDEKSTLKKSRKNVEATDVFKLRKSPRLHTIATQQTDEKKSANQNNKMKTPKKTDKGLVTDFVGVTKSPNSIHQAAEGLEGESLKKQGHKVGIPSMSKQNHLPTRLDGSTYESPETTHVSPSCKTPRRNAFDFNSQRSEDKFQVNQIWAIYSKKGMPSEYVKIRKIETKPKFVLRVTHMELYPSSTEPFTRSMSCGDFKLLKGRPKILPQASLSHQVKPFVSTNNIVKVYPKKGEIWALYKNCDSTKEEHDIVEVTEDYSDGEVLKAVALTAKCSSWLYTIQKKQGSNVGVIDIPKVEISRFSHQIPAVKHEKRTTRLVEGGYWELDPLAIPFRCQTIDLD